jgi:hypothetical protein
MVDLRENPLKEINGQRVIMVEDYQSSAAQLIKMIQLHKWICKI